MSAPATPSGAGARGGLDLVLFDLDGTVTDSGSGIIASYRHTLASLGLEADAAALRRCIGPPLAVSLASLGVPAADMGTAIETWRAWFGVHGILDNRLYDGIVECLDRIGQAGIRTGLATSKLRHYAVEILHHFGLADRFDPVCGATPDGRLTHKEDVVAAALADAGVAGSDRVAMIGDREHDMFGAAANHVLPVGVSWGYGDRRELAAAGARWIVDTPAALADLVLDLAAAGT